MWLNWNGTIWEVMILPLFDRMSTAHDAPIMPTDLGPVCD